jgi:hypothetical protein
VQDDRAKFAQIFAHHRAADRAKGCQGGGLCPAGSIRAVTGAGIIACRLPREPTLRLARALDPPAQYVQVPWHERQSSRHIHDTERPAWIITL